MGANVQAGYAAGMLVGSFIFGAISDIFGRRFCMLLCSVLAVRLLFKDTTKTANSLSFSSDLVRRVHARASVEQPRETRMADFPPRALCHARGHYRLSRVLRRTKKKKRLFR